MAVLFFQNVFNFNILINCGESFWQINYMNNTILSEIQLSEIHHLHWTLILGIAYGGLSPSPFPGESLSLEKEQGGTKHGSNIYSH